MGATDDTKRAAVRRIRLRVWRGLSALLVGLGTAVALDGAGILGEPTTDTAAIIGGTVVAVAAAVSYWRTFVADDRW